MKSQIEFRSWKQDRHGLIPRIRQIACGHGDLRVVPTGNRSVLALPSDLMAANNVLELYQPQCFKEYFLKALAHCRKVFPLRGTSIHSHDEQKSEPIVEWLRPAALAGSVGFLGCNPVHGPRCVLAGIDPETQSPLIGKLGLDRSRESIIREYQKTMSLSKCYSGIVTPLGLDQGDDWALMRLPYLGRQSPSSIGDASVESLLTSWRRDSFIELGDSSFVRDLISHVPLSCAPTNWHRDVCKLKIQESLLHGDFAVWNTRNNLLSSETDGGLIALDWEWAREDGIVGIDLAHALRQECYMVHRMYPASAVRWMLQRAESRQWKEYLDHAGWSDHLMDWLRLGLLHSHFNAINPSDDLLAAVDIHVTNKNTSSQTSVLNQGRKVRGSEIKNDHSSESLRSRVMISVVTPSFRQVEYLKRCAASIADQEGDFELEHLVQDAESGHDFLQWAKQQDFSDWVSEADHGMYDAINRGFKRAKGDILAWLNCDEQYLPGALHEVASYFQNHPEVDILIGDVVLVDDRMSPLTYRRSVVPTTGHIRYSHLSTFTAATFVRRRIIDDGLWLATRWKTISDAVWMDAMLSAGYRAAVLPKPLALFSMLGSNLGQSVKLFQERKEWEQSMHCNSRWVRHYHVFRYRIAKLFAGAYIPRCVTVAGYVTNTSKRQLAKRWLSGFWSEAKSDVDQQRHQYESAFSARPVKKELATRYVFFYAFIAAGLGFLADMIPTGDSVKAPLVMIFALLILTLRSKTRDLAYISIFFFVCSVYSLRVRPLDIAIVRLLTFIISAILAYISASILRDLEQWMGVTVGLLRRIPQPVILTNREGEVVLVNSAAEQMLNHEESKLLGVNLSSLIEDASIDRMECLISTWEDRPPTSKIILSPLINDHTSRAIAANVFMVGRGERRMFGFSLQGRE